MASESAVVIPAASLVVELVAVENVVIAASVLESAVAPAASIVVVPFAAKNGLLVTIPFVIPLVVKTDSGKYSDASAVLLLWYLHLLFCFM